MPEQREEYVGPVAYVAFAFHDGDPASSATMCVAEEPEALAERVGRVLTDGVPGLLKVTTVVTEYGVDGPHSIGRAVKGRAAWINPRTVASVG